MAYRVYTENGSTEFLIESQAIEFHKNNGIGDIEEFTIQQSWNKNEYIEEVNKAHSEWYKLIYARKPDLDYESKGEIAMYLEHPNTELRNQAKALTDLWFESVDLLYQHLDIVTEQTANIETFIASLPSF